MTRPGNRAARKERGKDVTPGEVLRDGLSVYSGRPIRVASLESRPLEMQSTHPINRLQVMLDSGERLRVIFKQLGSGPGPKGNGREVLIYRRLLSGGRFGSPALYASAYDTRRRRYWLFVEDLGDGTLEGASEACWLAAVRLLARMHGAYWGRENDLKALGCLEEHRPAYYRGIAEAARRHLRLAGAAGALARLDGLLARFDAVVAHLVHQPRTLIHGDVFSRNFLIQPRSRVRLIDWENAAIGLGALDLACLLDGWGTDKSRFLAAYLDELARYAAAFVDRRAFRLTFACCEIVHALISLAWSVEACQDAANVSASLRKMKTIWRRLEEERIDA